MNKEIKGIKCEVKNCKYHDMSNCCTAGRLQLVTDQQQAVLIPNVKHLNAVTPANADNNLTKKGSIRSLFFINLRA